jgi:hypothetical protein
MQRLIDFTDEELAAALHMIEGHEDGLGDKEFGEWKRVLGLILRTAQQQRELNS